MASKRKYITYLRRYNCGRNSVQEGFCAFLRRKKESERHCAAWLSLLSSVGTEGGKMSKENAFLQYVQWTHVNGGTHETLECIVLCCGAYQEPECYSNWYGGGKRGYSRKKDSGLGWSHLLEEERLCLCWRVALEHRRLLVNYVKFSTGFTSTSARGSVAQILNLMNFAIMSTTFVVHGFYKIF